MAMFWIANPPGFENRHLITRNPDYDSDFHKYDWKTQTTTFFNPLEPDRFSEGDQIELEDWTNQLDCVLEIRSGEWVEVSRTPWCWPELTYLVTA